MMKKKQNQITAFKFESNKLSIECWFKKANVDPYDLDLHDLLDYLERLELVDSLLQKSKQENQQENQRERQQEHPVFNKYKPDESTSSERKPK